MLTVSFLDYTLIPVTGDALSRLFAIIFKDSGKLGGRLIVRKFEILKNGGRLVFTKNLAKWVGGGEVRGAVINNSPVT